MLQAINDYETAFSASIGRGAENFTWGYFYLNRVWLC